MVIDKPTIADYTNATHDHSTNAEGGTLAASSISDFDTEVSNNTDVAANTAARHNALTVTDSSEIDFTLTGQDLTASLKTGSIDETKLDASVNASLDLADTAVQPAEIREKLTGNRTYYVATTGSDSNDGLSSGSPFLTIQKAVDTVANLDIAGFDVTIQLADGTYSEGVTLKNVTGFAEAGNLSIQGNNTTPANVIISATSDNAIDANGLAVVWDLYDFKVQVTTSGAGIYCARGSTIRFSGLDFGACASFHMEIAAGKISVMGNYSISGDSQIHVFCLQSGALFEVSSLTITFTNNVTFSLYQIQAVALGYIAHVQCTFSLGSFTVTGKRYQVDLNGVINTGGGGATYLPGTIAGTTATGGQYV